MANFPAPPNLNPFDPFSVLEKRNKDLDTSKYSYKLTGGQYGLDTSFYNDPEIDIDSFSIRVPFAVGGNRDGVGDVISIGGIDCQTRHKINPIVGFDHFKSVAFPIGISESPEAKIYTVDLDVTNQVAYGTAFLYQGKGMPGVDRKEDYSHGVFVNQLFDLLKLKLIRGASIGYSVKSATEIPADHERGIPKGLNLLATILLEYSIVVLPANARTVVKSFTGNPYSEWQENIAQVLSRNTIGGKPLSNHLIKSLSPYAPPKVAQLGYEGQKTMSYLNESTGGALVPPAQFGPKIPDKEKIKSLRKKYKAGYNIEGIHKPGFEAQREKEGIVTIPNSKWKPGRGAIKGQKNHGFVGTSNAGIPGNGLDGEMLKQVETTSPYITNGSAPDEFWASMTDSQKYKALRKKYKNKKKGIAGAVAGGAAGIEAGPAGVAGVAEEGASVGSQVEDAVTSKSQKKAFPFYGIVPQHNGFWIQDGYGQGIGPLKTREEAEARMAKMEASYQEEKRRKQERKGKKSAKAPGVIEEPNHKSISVKWRNKVVKGFAEVQLRFDMMEIDIDKQNAFLVEMMKEGFGTPAQGKYVSKEPPKLQSPLKQATFTFTIEPGNRQSEDDAVSSAIRTATQIAKRHGARYTGNIGKSIPNYSTKALDKNEGNMEPEEEEKDLPNDTGEGENEEKYSAQVLRHMHENALILLEEYDNFTEQLEHEEISGHLHEKLEDLVSEIETLEEMMEKHHPESEPLGADTKDMEEGGDEGNEEETPVEADSEKEEEPTPDEALEGMDTKDLRNKYIKALRKTFTKTAPGRGLGVEGGHLPGHEENDDSGLKKGPKLGTTKKSVKCANCDPKKDPNRKPGQGLGVEGSHLPGHEEYDNSGIKEMDDEELEVEDSHVPGQEADHEEAASGHMPEGVKGLQPHHKNCIEGAKGFLADASNEYNWDHEHRMKSYHWHKTLEETGDDAFGHMDGKSFPVMDEQDHDNNVNEPGEKSMDMPDDDMDNPIAHEEKVDFDEAKSMHPHHKCMMGASKFLKDMSDTFEYGDNHRQEAAQHHQNLDEMSKSFDVMDEQDHDNNVTEPGEMGEKGGPGSGPKGGRGGSSHVSAGFADDDLPSRARARQEEQRKTGNYGPKRGENPELDAYLDSQRKKSFDAKKLVIQQQKAIAELKKLTRTR